MEIATCHSAVDMLLGNMHFQVVLSAQILLTALTIVCTASELSRVGVLLARAIVLLMVMTRLAVEVVLLELRRMHVVVLHLLWLVMRMYMWLVMMHWLLMLVRLVLLHVMMMHRRLLHVMRSSRSLHVMVMHRLLLHVMLMHGLLLMHVMLIHRLSKLSITMHSMIIVIRPVTLWPRIR